MLVQELMSKTVHCCAPDDTLQQAAQQMWDFDCGSLPVCAANDGASRAIGIITDRDICMCALFQDHRLSELHVRDAMAGKLLSCRPTDSIEQAGSLMRDGQVRRLLVLDEQDALVGVISLADLARTAACMGRPVRGIAEEQVGDTLAAICAPRQPTLNA